MKNDNQNFIKTIEKSEPKTKKYERYLKNLIFFIGYQLTVKEVCH